MEGAALTVDVLTIFLVCGDRHHLLDALIEADPLGLIGEQLPGRDPGTIEGGVLYRLGGASHGVVVLSGKVRIVRQVAVEAIAERRVAIPKFLNGQRHELAADNRGPSIAFGNLRTHLRRPAMPRK